MKSFKVGDKVKMASKEFTGAKIIFRVHSRDDNGLMTLDPIDKEVQKKEGRYWQYYRDEELISS